MSESKGIVGMFRKMGALQQSARNNAIAGLIASVVLIFLSVELLKSYKEIEKNNSTNDSDSKRENVVPILGIVAGSLGVLVAGSTLLWHAFATLRDK